ncbi:MAG: gfo/Idh/MocA family oxidoreductase [Planctomycetes bacterium]|nr:gfo/Idh/MocA family oxidoreductase [Planctomycetota bacterium]NOG55706.1 Gfo/Idh/MocA family oxidoreductase [Planctomycetota bacterium]
MSTNEIRIGIIGLGFMGRVHVKAYDAAKAAGFACRLVAVSDCDESRLTGQVPEDAAGNIDTGDGETPLLFDPETVATYTDPQALLDNPDVDLVSICTHTDSHPDLTIAALKAGKHVLVEKPVATSSDDVRRVLEAVRQSETLCMPAMCMRFWPGWTWLKQAIENNVYGRVCSATFHRLGTHPGWAAQFYGDHTRSGGALVDLHIHDADFIRYLFGNPDSLTSTGTLDHLTTIYRYKEGPAHVVAEGGWDHSPGFNFRMHYIVNFERATAEFDLSRETPLIVYHDQHQEVIPLEPTTGYDGEIRCLLDAIASGKRDMLPTIEESLAVTHLLEEERESLQTGKIIDPA